MLDVEYDNVCLGWYHRHTQKVKILVLVRYFNSPTFFVVSTGRRRRRTRALACLHVFVHKTKQSNQQGRKKKESYPK